MEKLFKSLEDFREHATESDYQNLETYVRSQQNKQTAFREEDCPYPFSYTSAATLLRDHNQADKAKEPKEPEPFVIYSMLDADGKPKTWKSRSVSLSTSVLDRLDKLEKEHTQYTKKSILDALIDRALKDYGY